MTPIQKFNQYLHLKNQRLTPSRNKILKMLFKRHDHISLEELLDWSAQNDISRATLFRTLTLLIDAGMIAQIFDQKKRAHYEHIYEHKKHHHLVCLKCDKIIEIEDNFSEKTAEELCIKNNFEHQYNIFKIYGICGDCKA